MSGGQDLETNDRACSGAELARIVEAKPKDLGDLWVARALPSLACRNVGPFVFFDHFGPAEFAAGRGMDVRPHPHIGLATVTYLLEGEIVHRDSLGFEQAIHPGAINWMVAGRGIVHSERSGPEERARVSRLSGAQVWVALPLAEEQCEPLFRHHPADTIPSWQLPGVSLKLLLGRAYGRQSPVETRSPLFYLDADMSAGSELELAAEYDERAAYVLEGHVECDGEVLTAHSLGVFNPGCSVRLRASAPSRVLLFGGDKLDAVRHVWWNFVSSSKQLIEQAKADWQQGRFPRVPGDEAEWIPLPER